MLNLSFVFLCFLLLVFWAVYHNCMQVQISWLISSKLYPNISDTLQSLPVQKIAILFICTDFLGILDQLHNIQVSLADYCNALVRICSHYTVEGLLSLFNIITPTPWRVQPFTAQHSWISQCHSLGAKAPKTQLRSARLWKKLSPLWSAQTRKRRRWVLQRNTAGSFYVANWY